MYIKRHHRRESRKWIWPLAVLLLIPILATLIYSNTFSAAFQFDDLRNIVDNPRIRGLANLFDFASARYVGFLSFALNYKFGGLHVFGYHLVNLLIHITNGFLVYALVVLLFRASDFLPESFSARLIALATALLFIVHPLQTQAVTYIVQRFTSLATLFYLLCGVAYLRWRLDSKEERGGWLWYGVALVAALMAVKTKELALTLPIMIVVVEFFFFAPSTKRQWICLIPFFLILFLVPLSRFDSLGEAEAFSSQATTIPWSDYFFTQFRVVVTYLRLLVFPAGQNLDYDYPVYHSLFNGPVFVSFVFIAALFAAVVAILRRTPRDPEHASIRLAVFGVLWFFITLSAECFVFPIRDVIFEHRVYLPGVGLFLAFCVAFALSVEHLKSLRIRWIAGLVSMVAIITMFSVAAHQRNKIWKDEVTLWGDVTEKSPGKARAHVYLGNAYRGQGRTNDAIREYQAATQLQPGSSMIHYSLGVAYRDRGLPGKAIEEFLIALNLKPNFPEVRNELGGIYKTVGKFPEAISEYQTAIGLRPDYAEAHDNLGMVYREQRRSDDAVREYEAATRLQPDFAFAHNNLGMAYADQGRLDDAVREFQTATRLQPDYADAHNNLGIAYSSTGRLNEAIGEYQLTLRLQPGYAGTHNNLGNNYKDLGRFDDAIREYQQAIKVQPNFVLAHYNLGLLYQTLGRNAEAIAALKQALKYLPNFPDAQRALDALEKRR